MVYNVRNRIQFAIIDEHLWLFAVYFGICAYLFFFCLSFVCCLVFTENEFNSNAYNANIKKIFEILFSRPLVHFHSFAIQLFTLVSFCLLPSVLFIIYPWTATRGFCNQRLQCDLILLLCDISRMILLLLLLKRCSRWHGHGHWILLFYFLSRREKKKNRRDQKTIQITEILTKSIITPIVLHFQAVSALCHTFSRALFFWHFVGHCA